MFPIDLPTLIFTADPKLFLSYFTKINKFKKCRPTYPNSRKHAIGNTHFVGLSDFRIKRRCGENANEMTTRPIEINSE